jgi:hypothetical protein
MTILNLLGAIDTSVPAAILRFGDRRARVADLPSTELVDAARTANLALLRDLQRVSSQ